MTGQAPKRVLVLGASGMLGNAVLRLFADSAGYDARGTVRSPASARQLPEALRQRLETGVDVENPDSLARAGQGPSGCGDQLRRRGQAAGRGGRSACRHSDQRAAPASARALCAVAGARLVHVSTDCVFSGARGMYTEADFADANDLYGRSKYLGEVDYLNTVTLRTSIIGHELASAHGLVGWFLSQHGTVKGFRRAVFSGLPTQELARVMRDQVLPRPELHGVYHVSADPINKYELLMLLAEAYGKAIEIQPTRLVIDRSLDSRRFRELTGYIPPSWPQLVRSMRDFG